MPRVLKASTVYVDQDNMVQIKADTPPHMSILPSEAEEELGGPPPQELAKNVVKKAEDEAKFILKRSAIESKSILAKARETAAGYIAEAEIRMEAEGRRIHEENRQAGYQKGLDEARVAGEGIRAEAQSVLDAAHRERDEMRRALEPSAINLVIGIVEKLLGNIVSVNPAVLVALIRKGFAESSLGGQGGQVTIRVSEADYLEVVACKEELTAAAGGMVELDIVRDLTMGPLDCIIDTPYGGIDVSLEPQFEALKENLLFLLRHPV